MCGYEGTVPAGSSPHSGPFYKPPPPFGPPLPGTAKTGKRTSSSPGNAYPETLQEIAEDIIPISITPLDRTKLNGKNMF